MLLTSSDDGRSCNHRSVSMKNNKGGVVMMRNVYFSNGKFRMEYAIAYDRIGDYYFIKLVARDMQDENKNRVIHSVPLPNITLAEAIELYFRMNNLYLRLTKSTD